jgi:hypothetical protein
MPEAKHGCFLRNLLFSVKKTKTENGWKVGTYPAGFEYCRYC